MFLHNNDSWSRKIEFYLVLLVLLSVSPIRSEDEDLHEEEAPSDSDLEHSGRFNSAIKEPISTPEDLLTLKDGKDVVPALVRLITDAEFRDQKLRALKAHQPVLTRDAVQEQVSSKIRKFLVEALGNTGPLLAKRSQSDAEDRADDEDVAESRISDKDLDLLDPLLDMIPDIPLEKIHIHHIFPPALIRPLQKVIVRKIIRFIRHPPHKKLKRKLKRLSRTGTVALGLGLGLDALQEIKNKPTTAHYKVSGVVDLSGQKPYKAADEYEGKYEDHDETKKEYERRSDDMESDLDDPDYKTVKDYKLVSPTVHIEKKIHWPFHESKEEIYEKWNKFPAPSDPSPYTHKVKHMHKTFHEIHPDILHIIKDVHGLVGTKTKVIHSGPELEHPIVLAGQLIKLADSLIPSIRIRIPFIEYLISSFHKKSKPKVVYVKQPPKVKYVGVPYKEDDMAMAMPEPEGMPMPEPLELKVPITVPVPEVTVVAQPVPYKADTPVPYKTDGERRYSALPSSHQMTGNKNYELITREQLAQPEPHYHQQAQAPQPVPYYQPNYETHVAQPPQHPSYTKAFQEAARLYQDKSRARA